MQISHDARGLCAAVVAVGDDGAGWFETMTEPWGVILMWHGRHWLE
jgi:hypothetical protein